MRTAVVCEALMLIVENDSDDTPLTSAVDRFELSDPEAELLRALLATLTDWTSARYL